MSASLGKLIIVMSLCMPWPAVWCATPSLPAAGTEPEIDVVEIKLKINKVLSAPVFGETKREKRLSYIGAEEKKTESAGLFDFLSDLSLWLSRLSEILLWGLVLVAVVLLIKYRRSWWWLFEAPPPRRSTVAPEMLFGLDVRPESLPEDIPGEVMRLWRAGERVPAMSLLYRGALVKLIHQHGIAIAASFTEGECIEQVRRKVTPVLATHFSALTEVWLLTAYAHRPPATERVAGLCEDYKNHFMVPA